MKILQVFNQYRFKGGEEIWVDSIPSLLGDSAEVEDLRFNSSDWIGQGRPSLLKQVVLMGDNPQSRCALRSHASRFNPDIILFHNVIPVGSLGLYFEAKQLGIPVIQYTHNFRPFSPGGTLWSGNSVISDAMHGNSWPEILAGSWQSSRLKTALLAWHLNHALRKGLIDCVDHWLAISDFMRMQFISAGIAECKISTLRHCCTIPSINGPLPNRNHYLYLGRLIHEKGVVSMLSAWNQLHSSMGDLCPKLIIAGNGPLESNVLLAAESNPMIQYAGFVHGNEKQHLLEHAKAVMMPSIWWEPLGLTTYDAYSYGLPVIASRAGALLETVKDGITGWHHHPGDAADISRAVVDAEACGNEEMIRRGSEGFQWLKIHADPTAWRHRFISICQDIILKHKTNSA